MFLIALSPILWLIIALSVLKMAAYKACPIALVIALAAGIFVNDMTLPHAVEATLEGVALACWPILLVIIAAIFTYNLTLKTKAMDTIKKMLTSVSNDRRVLILLIGWGFGGFLEGMAGFGTAIAIPAGMLAGIGINPVLSAMVCLIANSVPTAYGSIGIPLVTLGSVTDTDPVLLATYTALQLAPLTILCPFLMVIVASHSLKGLKGMFLMCLTAGLGFSTAEIAISMFMGPELAVVGGAIVAMAAIIGCAKFFPVNDPKHAMPPHEDEAPTTLGGAVRAWMPFILIFVFIIIIRSRFCKFGKTGIQFFTWLATPGVLILLAAFLGGSVQGASFGSMAACLRRTAWNLRFTIVTIITVIATAKVMGYAGMTHEIAETAVAATGTAYPLIAAFIGSIGTFITGSATSSCVLFGKLQTDSAMAIGAGKSVQAWIAASNATGACAGKMISPQSIAIAVASIGTVGCEGKLLHFAVKFYIPFIIIMGCIVYFGQSLVG